MSDPVIESMEAVILCGGFGTRLRDVSGGQQKVMMSVDGKPFLDLLISYVVAQGVKRIILCTGYQAKYVEDYYREQQHGIIIDFAREEEPLGTGGALKNAGEIIFSDPFFVFNGDSFCPVDLPMFLDVHCFREADCSMVLSKVTSTENYGTVRIDKEGRVLGFYEKSAEVTSGFVNAGVYCCSQNIFNIMPVEKAFSLERDFFPSIVGKNFVGFPVKQEFYDIGTPERYQLAREILEGPRD